MLVAQPTYRTPGAEIFLPHEAFTDLAEVGRLKEKLSVRKATFSQAVFSAASALS